MMVHFYIPYQMAEAFERAINDYAIKMGVVIKEEPKPTVIFKDNPAHRSLINIYKKPCGK